MAVYSDDSSKIAALSRDSTVRTWATSTGIQIGQILLDRQNQIPRKLQFAEDDGIILIISAKGEVGAVNFYTGTMLYESPRIENVTCCEISSSSLANHHIALNSYSPTQYMKNTILNREFGWEPLQLVVSSLEKETIATLNHTSDTTATRHESISESFSLSKDRSKADFVSSDDFTEISSISSIQSLPPHQLPKDNHHSPRSIVCAHGGGNVTVRNIIENVAHAPHCVVQWTDTWCVNISNDGTRIATGSYGGVVTVWDTASSSEIQSLQGHTGFISHVCFDKSGSKLAALSSGNCLKVWDIATGQLICSHFGEFTSKFHFGG